jgi:glycine/D-amino acid oxidase-like deaminating enzyme
MTTDALTPDFVTTPFWWDQTPPRDERAELPGTRVDVAVIGAGYSGLFTALELARGGRDVLVLEAGRIGEHASTKNFGAVARTIRMSFSELTRRDGLETARRVYEEAQAWVEFTASFIEREGLDCRFYRRGRVVAAHSPAAYDAAGRELDLMRRHLRVETDLVPASEQHRELGSDVYHGCMVLHDVGHLDPGRYLDGVARLSAAAGARLVSHTRVVDVGRTRDGFDIVTDRGRVTAREVVLATNAETGGDNALFRYFRRRVVPVELYSGVSEPLDAALLASVFPTARTVLETRRLYLGMRPIEQENRLLVVGHHMRPYGDTATAARELKADVVTRYPQLAGLRFSHLWTGRFCVTFDWLPHFGTHDGVHYLHGLNGAGVPAAGYLGTLLARRMLGTANHCSVFADRPYPTRPGYTGSAWGSAWFLPALAAWYRYADRREARLSR